MANINGYIFEGPYNLSSTSFNDVPGVYFISDSRGNSLDVGETEQLATRLVSHERGTCWQNNSLGDVIVWFHGDSNQSSRLRKEAVIRKSNKFSCGQF